MRLRHLFVRACAIGGLLWPLAASAMMINDDPSIASFEVLAKQSAVAAHVRIERLSYRLQGTRIVTDNECTVLTPIFGAAVGDHIVVTTLGGYYGGLGQRVFGVEAFAPGDEVAILLGDSGFMGGGRSVVGLVLGAYHVFSSPNGTPETWAVVNHHGAVTHRAGAQPTTFGEFVTRALAAKS